MAQTNTSSKCPKCNRVFTGVGASTTDSAPPCVDLRVGNPLAARILSRVQVRCALDGCGWTGDYSELSAHLTASDSHHSRSALAFSHLRPLCLSVCLFVCLCAYLLLSFVYAYIRKHTLMYIHI